MTIEHNATPKPFFVPSYHLVGQFRAEIVEILLEITEIYNKAK